MAEDPQLASRITPVDNKRKYEEGQTPPPLRRPTGFSAPIAASPSPDSNAPAAAAPPPSYNTVPPPTDEIQAAKQRAQEIAARLFNSAEAKRPRLENGGSEDSNDKGFGSVLADLSQKPPGQQNAYSQFGTALPTSITAGYGFQGSSKKIDIPNGRVGVIIGKGGETIKYLQLQSGAKIQVTRDMDADPTSQTRVVELIGTPEQISKAEQLINDVLAEAEAGGSGVVAARRFSSVQIGAEQFTMKVPNNKVGLIIGKGGETIKNMQARSGAHIQLIPLHLPPGDTSTERTIQIDGTKEQVESAKQLINEVVSENRVRNPVMAGGYSQQGYRPPRPPANWGPPGPPMQQPGYGYMQPGVYPGPPPQYNTSQPPYAGYPTPPTSGGYSSGWDQTPVPPSQQTAQGSGYDYYGQQPVQQQPAPGGSSTPADNTSYNYGPPAASNYNPQGSYGESNYSQPPPVGQQQGFSQDGYGGSYHAPAPQPGYTQSQSNPQTGYDQQQAYSATPTYGSVANPTQDVAASTYGAPGASTHVPPSQQLPPPTHPPAANLQGYSGQQPPAIPTSYGAQAATQPGYGMPPVSQPGYGAQPPTQTGYGQSGPLTQPGYGQPQVQKPPTTQPIYGQSQQPTTSQGGYIQPAPVQPGYSHSQPPTAQSGYSQHDPSHLRAPPAFGSGALQSGYGQQQSYGGPSPVAQPGYAPPQQQPYGDSYGGAYAQPPTYSTDNAAGGKVHGAYDAPPAGQPVQSGVAKASPQ
ncbi:uncharacterized protein LOC131222849 [Magnolia sinica]|uniref:uncharacterized protein LOC131222849 n=1 Tax=Magnolia sinica TaxID=86752 RepID=UPI002657EBEF|nr:uncharacterized protein LOC131222849 [Magnolia sinica]